MQVTKMLQTFIIKCLQNILGISWPDTISNAGLWARTSQEPSQVIRRQKWRWLEETPLKRTFRYRFIELGMDPPRIETYKMTETDQEADFREGNAESWIDLVQSQGACWRQRGMAQLCRGCMPHLRDPKK